MTSSNNDYNKIMLLFCLICFSSFSLGQTITKCHELTTDTIFVNQCYGHSYDKPLIIKNGSIVINNSDSLILINNLRYRYYEKLRTLLNDSLDFNNEYVLWQYENIINNNKLQYNSLLENCDSTSNLFSRLTAETKLALNVTSKSLKASEQSLANAMSSLNEAQDLLQAERNAQFWDNLTIGFGGIGLGILIAILVE